MSDNMYCHSGFEKCRNRPSIHSIVSALLFIYAEYILITSLIKQGPIMRDLFLKNTSLPDIFLKQFTVIFVIFCSVFYVHFLRIYLSLLVMEKDVRFYKNVFNHLENKKIRKYLEWILRLLVLIVLVSFVSYRNEKLILKGFFTPILVLYMLLLTWDTLMLLTVLRKDERLFWLFNDLLGFFIALLFVSLEFRKWIDDSNLIYFVVMVGILGLVSIILLIVDLFRNFTRYLRYIVEEVIPVKFINCENLKCTVT